MAKYNNEKKKERKQKQLSLYHGLFVKVSPSDFILSLFVCQTFQLCCEDLGNVMDNVLILRTNLFFQLSLVSTVSLCMCW